MEAKISNIHEKVGQKGQKNPVKIPDVERVLCPAGDGANHSLVHVSDQSVICVHCRVSWVDLDEQIRGGALRAAGAKS